MSLPESFVKEYLEKVKGASIFGVPLEELTRDELLACVVAGFEGESQALKESTRQWKFFPDLMKSKRRKF